MAITLRTLMVPLTHPFVINTSKMSYIRQMYEASLTCNKPNIQENSNVSLKIEIEVYIYIYIILREK